MLSALSWVRIDKDSFYVRFFPVDIFLDALNGRFDLKNIERTSESDFDCKQRLSRPHLHGKKISNAFHRRVINDDPLHLPDTRAVGALSNKKSPRLSAQEHCNRCEENSDEDRRKRIKVRIMSGAAEQYSKECEKRSHESSRIFQKYRED